MNAPSESVDDVLALMDELPELMLLSAVEPCHKRMVGIAPKIRRARAAIAELIAERDRLQAMLDTNRCNSGHETLPLMLWDCPECHNETKRRLAELVEAGNRLQSAMPSNKRSLATYCARDELMAFRAALARAGGAK